MLSAGLVKGNVNDCRRQSSTASSEMPKTDPSLLSREDTNEHQDCYIQSIRPGNALCLGALVASPLLQNCYTWQTGQK